MEYKSSSAGTIYFKTLSAEYGSVVPTATLLVNSQYQEIKDIWLGEGGY